MYALVVLSIRQHDQLHCRRAAVHSQLKSKVGNILAKATPLRINLNIDGALSLHVHTHTPPILKSLLNPLASSPRPCPSPRIHQLPPRHLVCVRGVNHRNVTLGQMFISGFSFLIHSTSQMFIHQYLVLIYIYVPLREQLSGCTTRS
jgi:hypothetical protein